MLATFFALLAAAAVTTGQAHTLTTPEPIVLPPPVPGVGYYIMAGNAIVSQPYATAADCMTALARAKSKLTTGADHLVCAHRHP